MTAREKRREFVKTYLKPALRNWGYKTSGHNWWKDRGSFFTIIKIQNSSRNNINDITFYFNTGIAFKVVIEKGNEPYPNIYNSSSNLISDFFLPEDRKEHLYKNNSGYKLTGDTDLNSFINEFKSDFEGYILPSLERLKTAKDCIDQFGDVPFSGDDLKQIIKNNKL